MAKIDYKKLRNELFQRTERYAEGVRVLYDQALADIAKEFTGMDYDPNRVFSFDAVGKFGKIDTIMRRLESQIEQVVEKGIVSEFGEAYRGCNELIRQVVGERLNGTLEKAFMPMVASGNAAKAFIRANSAGNITASQRVWNGAVLGQMETAVEEALIDGVGAKRMATILEDYLIKPDECFRRFRVKKEVDANGKSIYGRKWKKRVSHRDGSTTWKDADPRNYPSGQGVYHSSYRNALRYARTTTNIAYRTADYDRYQEFPFVIGIEIHTSNNPAHVRDICDDLAGRYPKDFKWTGWHPNCMCYQVPILASKTEVDEMVDAVLDDKDPNDVECEGIVETLPDNFVRWAKANKGRMDEAKARGSLPYFIRDNEDAVEKALRKRIVVPKVKTQDEQWIELSDLIGKTGKIYNFSSPNANIQELYFANPIAKFDLVQFHSDFEEIVKHHNDKIKTSWVRVFDNEVNFQFWTKKGIQLSRTFGRLKNGEVYVSHDLLSIPKNLQGKSISKEVFRKLYDGYQRAGVDIITVHANIDRGGYTWCRYGFTFKHGEKYLTNMLQFQQGETGVDCSEALGIVKRWYKDNDPKDPFPMNLLCGYSWSKGLLKHADWDGILRLDDVLQMQVFKDYLGI